MPRFLLSTCLGALALFVAGPIHANDELTKMSQDPNQWVMPTGDYANHRYSQLKQITAQNVGKLQVAWTFSTGVLRGHEGAPLVIGDVMYVHGPFPNPVYALDLNKDAKILWKYEPKQDPDVIPVMCCDTVNRGLAYADGKIFLHQADTTLVALDAKDGKVIWQAKNGDPKKGETGTSAPLVVKDKVLVGISGGEFGVQCHMTAYDLKTGKQVWRAYSAGPDEQLLVDPEKTTEFGKPIGKDSSLRTWQGDQWKTGGGCTWGWISYDPALNLIYYGSGNPSTWNPKQRPGDNKWSMTIWARNPDTGMAKWVYQMTPHDEWDFDGVNEMILADQNIGGAARKILVHFDRNGFGYTLDRVSGELLVAEKFDPKVNWATKVDMDKNSKTYGRPLVVAQYSTEQNGQDVNSKGICPAALGSKDEQPAAFSPVTGLFYVPTNHVCMDYEPYRVELHGGSTLCRRDAVDVSASGRKPHGQFHCLGCAHRQDRLVGQRGVLGLVRRPGDGWGRGVLRNARRLPQSRRCQDGQGTLQIQDPVRYHRKRDDIYASRQTVHRRSVRRGWLGRHRAGGWPDRTDGGPRRRRWLCRIAQLHLAWRPAHCLCDTLKRIIAVADELPAAGPDLRSMRSGP